MVKMDVKMAPDIVPPVYCLHIDIFSDHTITLPLCKQWLVN
jgi:hypothetical protein